MVDALCSGNSKTRYLKNILSTPRPDLPSKLVQTVHMDRALVVTLEKENLRDEITSCFDISDSEHQLL